MRSLDELLARQSASTGVPAIIRPILEGGDAAGRAALASECARISGTPPGGRDDALNTGAYRMGQLVGAGHLELTAVLDALTEAGLACGQSPAEVARALRQDESSAVITGMANPRRLAALEPNAPVLTAWTPPTAPEPEELSAAVREAFPVVDWASVWEEDAGEDWILEPIIAARRLIALYSPPKTGKSLLMLELAAAIATGRGALGIEPAEPRRVLYVDHENDIRGDIVPRLRAMGYGPEELAGRLEYLSFPTMSPLDTLRGGAELLGAAIEYRSDLVVIDTISRAIAGEENTNDTWLAFYRNTGARLKSAGIACVRLDHSGKDVEKGMRGGSAKYSDVDAVWQLSEVEKDKAYKLLCTDNRFPIAEKELIIRRQVSPLAHRVDPEGSYGVFVGKLAQTIAKLDELEIPPASGIRGVAEILREAGFSAGQSMVSTAQKARRDRLEEDE